MTDRDDDIARRARELYRRASRDVDPAMAGRLRAARRTAVTTPASSPTRRLLLPAGAFAMLAIAALLVWQPGQNPLTGTPVVAMATDVDGDLPPDADNADPSMVEHLAFYTWLAADSGKTDRQ